MNGPTVLCSRPEYFSVEYQDNSYQEEGMLKWAENPKYWRSRILKMWDSVANELIKRNATLIKVTPKLGLHDQCFAADPVVMIIKQDGSRIAIPSNMNSPNRQGEVDVAVAALQNHGFIRSPHADIDHLKHEGTGDLLYLAGHGIFVQGYGPRSQCGVSQAFASALNQIVAEVPLDVTINKEQKAGMINSSHTKGFHLDTLAWPLPNRYFVGCFDRMSDEARAFFRAMYPPSHCINLTEEEADLFIANSITAPALPLENSKNGFTAFIPASTPNHIQENLKDWGFALKQFDVEGSKLAGAGLHCMFNYALFESFRPTAKPDVPPKIKVFSPR